MSERRKKPCHDTFHLPVDLIVEILSRLPVKSLLRFSVVCNTWKSIIKSSNLIFKHLKQYPVNANLTYNSLMVFIDGKAYDTCFFLENVFQKPVQVDFPFPCKTDFLMIVGVCDGLICIKLSDKECDFVICNPATRQFNRIPPCQQWNKNCFNNDDEWEVFGFGIHPSADDYKLVRITCTCTLSGEFIHRAEIYSMSTEDWRVIDLNMPFGSSEVMSYEPDEVALAINGVFYWAAQDYKEMLIIVSFNVNCQELRVIDSPNCSGQIPLNIIQLKQEIALIVDTYVERSFVCNVWVLNASTSCWSKKFKFDLPSEIKFFDLYFRGDTKSDNILFQDIKDNERGEIYLYDLTRKEIKRLPFDQDKYICKGSYSYVESLLPVKKKDQELTEKSWC